jgi:hypothetical protein
MPHSLFFMKFCSGIFLFSCLLCFHAIAQTNLLSTDSVAEQVMLGNYGPSLYQASTILNNPITISNGILSNVSPDSLHAYLNVLRTFRNHNTSSDTVSSTNGIGAARRWAYSKFQQFSAANQNRLIPSYFQFDYTDSICGVVQHRNIFAVLPGLDTSDKSIIIVEAHIDSRCENVCDTASLAQGMEDNGSGTALVLELARVMSEYSYNHTIVFMLTTGEEQGLYGAQAFATYAHQNGISIKGVLNNDVIGGIFCGYTSSAPSCPGYGNIDSNNVRIFSLGSFNSFHKGLARFVKLEYKERILPFATVPMTINIMTPEDRTGRGGDHEPFTSLNYPSIRFTAANEDGDADVTDTAYHDRQHTTRDTLGVDTNNDGIIDSFFIDFDYLARNTIINGNAIGMMGIGPKTPDFALTGNGQNNLVINITQQQQYNTYKVGVRTTTNDWDSVFAFSGSLNYTISNLPPEVYIVSVASVDSNGIESIFSEEKMASVGVKEISALNGAIQLLQNNPNPADEVTSISVLVNSGISYTNAYISICDMAGKEIRRLPLQLKEGMNETAYRHGDHASGTFIYTLVVDGKTIQSRRMVFTN